MLRNISALLPVSPDVIFEAFTAVRSAISPDAPHEYKDSNNSHKCVFKVFHIKLPPRIRCCISDITHTSIVIAWYDVQYSEESTMSK